jgi:hypothetical protein
LGEKKFRGGEWKKEKEKKIDKGSIGRQERSVPRFSVALSLTNIKHLSLSVSLSLAHRPLFLTRKGIFRVCRGGVLAEQCPNLVHRRQDLQRHNFLLERVAGGSRWGGEEVGGCSYEHAAVHNIYNGPTNALVCNKTLIQMSHIKTLKITPTCFDHQLIIIR